MTSNAPRPHRGLTAPAVLAFTIALLTTSSARAESPPSGTLESTSDGSVEAWVAAHPGSRRFDVVDARRERGVYFGLGLGGSVALSSDVLPATPVQSSPHAGFGATLTFGGSVGRLGIGLRTDVVLLPLVDVVGGTEDGRFVSLGVEGELDVSLARVRNITVHLAPRAGIAALFADVPLVPEDGVDRSPTRIVPKAGLGLGMAWNWLRVDVCFGATFPNSTSGTRALPGVLPLFELRAGWFFHRSGVTR